MISPPSSRAISREIERPRPVPPYLREVVPSACWKASKIRYQLVVGDPHAGVDDGERDHALGLRSVVVAEHLTRWRRADRQRDVAVMGELERVREQVLEDLAEPLLV